MNSPLTLSLNSGEGHERRASGQPLVGVLGYLVSPEETSQRGLAEGGEHAVFPLNYFDHVAAYAMLPVGIPAVGAELAPSYVDVLDGLVLTGGPDVHPLFYGEEPQHPRVRPALRQRDEFEIEITRAAVARDIPILAVCRGAQVLNVALGGTLLQHVDPEDGYLRHGTGSPTPAFHDVDVVDDELKVWLGERVTVNSLHHQGLRTLGSGLHVAGTSPDGLIEAVLDSRGRILGVQWHPERLALGVLAGDAPFAWLQSKLLGVAAE